MFRNGDFVVYVPPRGTYYEPNIFLRTNDNTWVATKPVATKDITDKAMSRIMSSHPHSYKYGGNIYDYFTT